MMICTEVAAKIWSQTQKDDALKFAAKIWIPTQTVMDAQLKL